MDVASRDRTAMLGFVAVPAGSFVFRRGVVQSPSAATTVLERVGELPAALRAPLELALLPCPAGAGRRDARVDAGLDEWCAAADGLRVGPGRRWFHAGLYLMERGEYRGGEKVGVWTECDRFERCRRVDHSAAR